MKGVGYATPPWEVAAHVTSGGNDETCPVRADATFEMEGWHVWCPCVVKDPQGGYSLFFSRWPVDSGHDAWVTHSEICRAEGASATGPFHFKETVFAPSEEEAWDARNFHNVTVRQYGGKFYLYYTGNHGTFDWWERRNNQRIGVAVADAVSGPWRRMGRPLIDISKGSWDSLCVTNPTVTETADGSYLMIYKGVTEGNPPFGSRVLHGLAVANDPSGPFCKLARPVFDLPGRQFGFEDPHLWQTSVGYHCLIKRMAAADGSFGSATVLVSTSDPFDWSMESPRLVATPHLLTASGDVRKVERLERPYYFSDGDASCLAFAVKQSGDCPSFIVFERRNLGVG